MTNVPLAKIPMPIGRDIIKRITDNSDRAAAILHLEIVQEYLQMHSENDSCEDYLNMQNVYVAMFTLVYDGEVNLFHAMQDNADPIDTSMTKTVTPHHSSKKRSSDAFMDAKTVKFEKKVKIKTEFE